MINLECEPWLWNAIIQHLNQTTGLACANLGILNIRRSIANRMASLNCKTVASYWVQLQQNSEEWQAFLNEVVVPETSFFRDRVPFQLLAKWAKDHCFRGLKTDRKLQILCLPCSTGEEAYSIALSLLAAGLTLEQFRIEAIDLSDRAVATAKKGCYSTKPIGIQWERCHGYWQFKNDVLQISPLVQKVIKFKVGNVRDLVLNSDCGEEYDLIFCRNLLIYFDSETRQQVLSSFHHSLMSDGLLFVGHAETGALGRDRWTAVPHAFSFAYHKATLIEKSIGPKSILKSLVRDVQFNKLPKKPGFDFAQPSLVKQKPVVDLLTRSKELANNNQLNEALKDCELYLKEFPMCSDGYFLMGQIYQAMKLTTDAERYLKRSIYLEPQNTEALMQLALLRDGTGDRQSGDILRDRIRRSD